MHKPRCFHPRRTPIPTRPVHKSVSPQFSPKTTPVRKGPSRKCIYEDEEEFNPFDGWHVGEIYLPVLCGKMPVNLVGGERSRANVRIRIRPLTSGISLGQII